MGLVVVCVVVLLSSPIQALEEFLYHTTVGASLSENDYALYGGPIDAAKNGSGGDLKKFGYSGCLHQGDQQTELKLESISYDPYTLTALLQVYVEDFSEVPKLTLARGPLCEATETCDATDRKLETLFYKWPYSEGDNLGPFASVDGAIYFIHAKTKSVIELKEITGCKTFPIGPAGTFDLTGKCTRTVSTLVNEKGTGTTPGYHEIIVQYGTTNTLVAVELSTGEFVFFTQLEKFTSKVMRGPPKLQSVVQTLVVIQSDGSMKELDQVLLSENEMTPFNLPHSGGVSLRDGKICWTIYTKLSCGDWDEKNMKIDNKQEYLNKLGSNIVCSGGAGFSGVAIPENAGGSVYFGCDNKSKGMGGMGQVYPPKGKQHSGPLALKSSDGTLIKGNGVFLTQCVKINKIKKQKRTSGATRSAGVALLVAVSWSLSILF